MPIFGTEKSTYENKSTTETINEFELYESEKIHENINQDIKIEKQALEELLKTPQKINKHQKNTSIIIYDFNGNKSQNNYQDPLKPIQKEIKIISKIIENKTISIKNKSEHSQPVKQEIQSQKEQYCFLFWCW